MKQQPRLLFFATEDWFVRSHFAPLLRRALAEGFETLVAARASGALADFANIRVVDTPFSRGSMRPWHIARHVAHLRAVLAEERPDIVHAIALKPMSLLAWAGWRNSGRVFALTGRGYLGVRQSAQSRMLNRALRSSLRAELKAPRALLLVENEADRDWLSHRGDLDSMTLTMPGAGVNPQIYRPAPPVAGFPIVVGVVARLIWTKGIDLAVAAVQRLRGEGENIVLRIAGAVDEESPEAVPAEQIAHWRALDGIEVMGPIDDVNAFWAEAHIACLPSRGGEGLPRALLEAAACGRPLVTTDAPGCGAFVSADIGLVVPRNDADALARALRRLGGDATLRARMGAAAREKVVAGYTEDHAADVAAQAWRRVWVCDG